jgi:hypothetical protein
MPPLTAFAPAKQDDADYETSEARRAAALSPLDETRVKYQTDQLAYLTCPSSPFQYQVNNQSLVVRSFECYGDAHHLCIRLLRESFFHFWIIDTGIFE